MVAETCILRMGNQVSNNVKNALLVENPKNISSKKQQVIGILSFEVANAMSKIIHLHKSLADFEVFKLKNGILKSVGIRTLVSDDENRLIELALVEKIDDLNRVASVVSRLGRKCTVPALQGFEHVYGDITCGVIDVKVLGFLVKDMEGTVKKMERLVNSTTNLYSEMEVMNKLEMAMKKFQQNQHEESRKVYEQKLAWQEQDVRQLKDLSLWNQTYDKVVELLVRTVCTVYARIKTVFGDAMIERELLRYQDTGIQFGCIGNLHQEKRETSERSNLSVAETMVEAMDADFAKPALCKSNDCYCSGPIERGVLGKRSMSYKGSLFGPEYFNLACGMGTGRRYMECLSSSSSSKTGDDCDLGADERSSQISGCCSVSSGMKREQHNIPVSFDRSLSSVRFNRDAKQLKSRAANAAKHGPKSRITLYAPPTTVGGSALAMRYANVIIIIEKLLCYPHLVGEEARDDLYQMLPTRLRRMLKTSLKICMSGLAIYDAPLAHNCKDRLGDILTWLAPLAHNMIRWLSEQNFKQQQIVKRTNVLLLQTLFFADRDKMEAAICELLVGLNYIYRYEQQQNALLDCVNSFHFEDCMEWQLQLGSSFNS